MNEAGGLDWDDRPLPKRRWPIRLAGCFPDAVLLFHAFVNGLLALVFCIDLVGREPDAGHAGRYFALLVAIPLAWVAGSCAIAWRAKRRPSWAQAVALVGLVTVFTLLPLALHHQASGISGYTQSMEP